MEIDGVTLRFTPNATAPEVLQRFSAAYWEWEGFDEAKGSIVWARPTSLLPAIDATDARPHVLAALGGALELDGARCPSCGSEPHRPTGRTNVFPEASSQCQSCSVNLRDALARASAPQARERATVAARRRQQAAAEVDRARRLEAERRSILRDVFRIGDEPVPDLDLEQAAHVVALANVVDDGAIGPFESIEVAPPGDGLGTFGLLESLYRSKVLRIDPESDVEAFVWNDGSPDQINLLSTAFVAAGAGSEPERFAVLVATARERLEVDEQVEVVDIEDLLRRALVGECLRYLDEQLRRHSIDRLTPAHHETLDGVVRGRGASLPLGRLHRAAWTAVRTAVSARAQHPMARKAVTSAAVNAFVKAIDAALERGHHEDPFVESSSLPLTPWTSVVFRVVAQSAPMTDSVVDIVARIRDRANVPACAARPEWRERLGAWLSNPLGSSADTTRLALEHIRNQTGPVWPCGGRCTSHEWADWVAARALAVDDVLLGAGVDDATRQAATLRAVEVGGATTDVGSIIEYVLDTIEVRPG